jgi:hypothetical protein
MVNKIRNSNQLIDAICEQYENCDITSLDDVDEIYISHYNLDNGGDHGLFTKHYDGVLRTINDATIARVLVYINSNDDYIVHFIDSNISHNFKTYEYGILDFNREYHYVQGKFNENTNINDTRILFKFNYLICPKCTKAYKNLLKFINNNVFFIVKKSMEYSKSPKTPFQKFIGYLCNLFRRVNNISSYLSLVLAIFIIIILFVPIFYLIKILNVC